MDVTSSNRRDFLKTTGCAALAAGIAGSGSLANSVSAGEIMNSTTDKKPIEVHHEWGALKEVVVGTCNVRVPTKIAASSRNYLPDSSIEFMEKNAGKRLEEIDPDLNAQFVEQVDAIIKILKGRGIVVHQLEKHNDSEEAFLQDLNDTILQTYPRDPMVVIGNNFIETSMYEPYRRKERFAVRRTIGERLENSNANIVSMPQAEPYPADTNGKYGPGPFLEGGDVMLMGKDIYVGNTGNASNTAGINWLQRFLGNEYNVHEVPLSKSFLHLDCVLALPRPGLAIICPEGFANGIPDFLKDWKLIEVSHEDAEKKLGCNGMILDEKTAIIGTDMPNVADALDAAGTEVLTTPIDAIYWQGGGFRCWHHPLVRES